MTVIINIGRRVPRGWLRRTASTVKGLISFQENMWQMIKQSMNLAKKKANFSNTGIQFIMTSDDELEDINWKIEWMKILIKGNELQEKEEYEEAMNMYKDFRKQKNFKDALNKGVGVDENLKRPFKSRLLSPTKIDEAYKAGYGSVEDSNIANKLLEMGILTHIEWVKDF
jgi:hypothetical protein